MNEVFLIGKIIEQSNFRFILNNKHKSEICMKIKTLDGNIINLIAYDKSADYIVRNNFLNKMVFMQGKINSVLKKVNIYFIKVIG